MNKENNIELTRGQKEYEAQVKNLEGIFDNITPLFDISTYKNEFERIQEDFRKDTSFSKSFMYQGIQMDYEGFIYSPYIDRLKKLTDRLEDDILPFYELYLLSQKTNDLIALISESNIDEIIKNCIKIIDTINELNTHNKEERNKIISSSYKVVYSGMLHEEIFDQSDIFSYINKLNIPANKENIGRLLFKDLDNLDKKQLINEQLRAIKTEGLGFDYLTPSIIKKVSEKTLETKYSHFVLQRVDEVARLKKKLQFLNGEKEQILKKLEQNQNRVTKVRINKTLMATKIASLVLIPITMLTSGHALGKTLSNNTPEYKTTTRTINFETGEQVGEPEFIYDEKETTYVATITVYDPWKLNPTGKGYIRKYLFF